MMKRNRLTFSGEQRAWVVERARAGVSVEAITKGLNTKCGATFTAKQVHGLVAAVKQPARPITKQQAVVAEPAGGEEQSVDVGADEKGGTAKGNFRRLSRKRLLPEEAARVMGVIAAWSFGGAEKAYAMMRDVEDTKELVATVSAAKTLVGILQLALGMDGAGVAASAPGTAAGFDFNFANVRTLGETAEGGSSGEH